MTESAVALGSITEREGGWGGGGGPPDEHTQDVNNAVCLRRHSQNRERLDKCKEGVFESFCLLMKARSSG